MGWGPRVCCLDTDYTWHLADILFGELDVSF